MKYQKETGKDLRVPQTWEEYTQVCKFFAGWDWDNDGQNEFGCDEYLQRGRMYWWWLDRFAAMGGVYFDEEMKPLINTKAGVAALQNMIDTVPSMPVGALNHGYTELRLAIINGDVAMGKQWTDVGKAADLAEESKVKGLIGYALVPGWQWGTRWCTTPCWPVAGSWAFPRTQSTRMRPSSSSGLSLTRTTAWPSPRIQAHRWIPTASRTLSRRYFRACGRPPRTT